MPNPFAETGAASSFVFLLEDYDMGFHGSDSQLTLTPLQRQIIEAEKSRQAEQQEERMPDDGPSSNQPSPSRPLNSKGSAGGGGNKTSQQETVRYVNTSENPDYDS